MSRAIIAQCNNHFIIDNMPGWYTEKSTMGIQEFVLVHCYFEYFTIML